MRLSFEASDLRGLLGDHASVVVRDFMIVRYSREGKLRVHALERWVHLVTGVAVAIALKRDGGLYRHIANALDRPFFVNVVAEVNQEGDVFVAQVIDRSVEARFILLT